MPLKELGTIYVTCCRCGADLDIDTRVGNRCPNCGVKFTGGRQAGGGNCCIGSCGVVLMVLSIGVFCFLVRGLIMPRGEPGSRPPIRYTHKLWGKNPQFYTTGPGGNMAPGRHEMALGGPISELDLRTPNRCPVFCMEVKWLAGQGEPWMQVEQGQRRPIALDSSTVIPTDHDRQLADGLWVAVVVHDRPKAEKRLLARALTHFDACPSVPWLPPTRSRR